jgi:hypothetical protein
MPFLYNKKTTAFEPGTMAYGITYYKRIDEVISSRRTTGIV